MNVYNKFKNLCQELDHYPRESELIYKHGLTHNDMAEVYQGKLIDEEYLKLDLYDQKGEKLFYWNSKKIIRKFADSQDLIRNSVVNQFSDFSDSEMLNGFIFSEIESSLAIEGVRSTRAEIEKLSKVNYEDLEEKNDIIIKNMLLGYEFVKENDITKENIFKLYEILSKKCLKEEEKLLPNNFYRHAEVSIVDALNTVIDRGVNWQMLPKLMDGLIDYINQKKEYEEHLIASHIIHYYLVYLHPYFDYNGRMGRVLSFWYNFKKAPSLSLLLVSEAINNKVHKKDYYNAIMNSRKSENDITYFLEYMGDIILKYSKIYINFYTILDKLKTKKGIEMPRSNEIALKHILIIHFTKNGYFNWKDYKEFSNDNFSKQYYLRLLNELEKIKILTSSENKKVKLFKLNLEKIDLF